MKAKAATKNAAVIDRSFWRFHLVWVLLALLGGLLVARIIMLQLVDTDRGHQFLKDQGDARAIRTVEIQAHRGMIADRNGEPLAVSTPVFSIWANPRRLVASKTDIAALAKALGLPIEKLTKKLESPGSKQFLYLRRQVPPPIATEILDLDIEGIYARREFKRYYPAGEVSAHLVGFTDVDEKGQEGVELAYNEFLESHAGAKQVVKDLRGRTIGEIKQIKEAQPGGDLQLSIDLRIQYAAYRALKQTVSDFDAAGGSVVVLDVKTGEILALASQPAYNPNNRSLMKVANLRNRAITDVFEPGSTVKPFTVLAALESGLYTPDTIIDTHPGYIRVGRKTFEDHHNYGPLNVTQIITKSSQVGTTKIALSLDPEQIRETFYRLGLGQASGTGFPGEALGVMPSRRHWRDIERANFAFGYGLSVTTLQLAQAYQVVANGGYKMPLSLLKLEQPAQAELVVEPLLAKQIRSMLETVGQQGGTAAKAQVEAYNFAGKTGTVHKVGASGYDPHRYMSLFAGMAPVNDPRLVGVVVIDDPKGDKYYGGLVAAPIFSQVIAKALPLLNARPDKLDDFSVMPLIGQR
ncbi:MAG: penicillin-binding transpeptidase domain-containing protein [Pseudomonadales bacterium]